MNYGLMRAIHPNSRYDEATKQLTVNELMIVLNALHVDYEVEGFKSIGGVELICFTMNHQSMTEKVRQALLRLSSVRAIFEIKEDWLRPVSEGYTTYFKDDLASILKYSGKTNETFTSMMINVGVFASDFAANYDQALTVFDPMSGKGTTLFRALIQGYNAMGVELSKNDGVETNQFLKRYLKYHHYKHEAKHQTIVQKGKNHGTKYTLITADSKEHYKANDLRQIQFASGNTLEANLYYKKESAHVLVTDLPYGVQHDAGDTSSHSKGSKGHIAIETLMAKAAPEWYKILKKGGVGVIAYNTYHLKRDLLAEAFKAAGFKVLEEAPYLEFEHWVEQAVNRDILVIKKG